MKRTLVPSIVCSLLFFTGCDNTGKGVIKLADTNSDNFIVFHDAVYFSSYTDLWKTDGTKKGTAKFTNINSKTSIRNLTVANNLLYFLADDGVSGNCLWFTDGSAAGTKPVKDREGNFLLGPESLTVYNNKLFLAASGDKHGTELWICGGTPETTYLLKNIRPDDTAGSYVDKLTVCGDLLYFSANDGQAEHGINIQLWQTDGTPEGTVRADIANQADKTIPYCLACAEKQLYFFSDSSIYHTGLWKTNGTAGSMTLVKKLKHGLTNEFTNTIAARGNQVFMLLNGDSSFSIPSEEEGVFISLQGAELWKSDGTAEGTLLVTGIDTAYGSDNVYSMNGKLYFLGAYKYGGRLWQSDGTKEGTFPLSLFDETIYQFPFAISEYEGKVYYFIMNTETKETSLAVTDGKTNTLLNENFFKGNMAGGYHCMYNNMIVFAGNREVYAMPLSAVEE